MDEIIPLCWDIARDMELCEYVISFKTMYIEPYKLYCTEIMHLLRFF